MTSQNTSASTLPAGGANALPPLIARVVETRAFRRFVESMRFDVLTAFLIRVSSAAILYLTQIVLARWMGAFDYGIYVFVWSWVLILGGLAHLGLATAMMRLLPEHRARGEDDAIRGLVRGGRMLAFGGGVLLALVCAALLWTFNTWVADYYTVPLLYALVCLPFFSLTELQDGIGRARGWIFTALAAPYLVRPLLLLAGMAAAVALALPMTATTAAAVSVAATALAAALHALMLRGRLKAAIAPGARRYVWRRWFGVSLPLLVFAASELIFQNADVLTVSFYLTPADAGMYFAAAKTMSLVMFVHFAVGNAMASQFASACSSGHHDQLTALIGDAVRWTFWPSLLLALAILGAGKPLLGLFAPEFTAAYPVMLVLAAGFMARAAVGPSEIILNMLGQQRACAAVLTVAALINIALCLILTPRYGAIGAASATSISMTLAASLNALVARRRLGLVLPIWRNVRLRRPPTVG